MLADGTNFPDALSGSVLDQPILYTRGSALPAVSLGYLNSSASVGTIYAVGGPAATAATNSPYRAHVTSFVGTDRYATSALVAASLVLPGTTVFAVATGQNFPDALVGATLAPVLLTTPQSLPTTVAAVLQHRAPAVGTVYLLGTSDVVSDTVGTQVQAALRAGEITTWPQPTEAHGRSSSSTSRQPTTPEGAAAAGASAEPDVTNPRGSRAGVHSRLRARGSGPLGVGPGGSVAEC